MIINKVFLDVDGVLANFNKRAFNALGLKYDYNHPALKNWHWYKYFNLSFDELDSVCNQDFWSGVQWMHDGRDILTIIEKQFSNIYLLTTPMPNPGSWTGKYLWIKRHLLKYLDRLIITKLPKHLYASPTSLLIDDKYENCQEFQDAGGYAILVPRPWNGGGDTLSILQQSLEEFKR